MKKTKEPKKDVGDIIVVDESSTLKSFRATVKDAPEHYTVQFNKPYPAEANLIALECVKLGCKVKH